MNNCCTYENVNMDRILASNFGEESSEIHVSFKKTIMIEQYQPEVFSADTVIKVTKAISGVERALIVAIARAQLEYEAYAGLYMRNLITDTQFNTRKAQLETDVEQFRRKFIQLTGRDATEYV